MIVIHPTARISSQVDIEDSVRGTCIRIGVNSSIDSFVKIKPAGGSGDLIIGDNTVVNSGCVFYSGNGITIGNHVSIAANCTFAPVNHEYKSKDILIQKQGFRPSKGGISIEDDVWIGANCVILDGANIGKGCVVAAGSIVRGNLAEFGIYGGSPLRQLGQRE